MWMILKTVFGSRDDALDRSILSPATENANEGDTMVDDGHTADHLYDCDLIVISGRSGGMAAAIEAASLGAMVAFLVYVKLSLQGTSWGHVEFASSCTMVLIQMKLSTKES